VSVVHESTILLFSHFYVYRSSRDSKRDSTAERASADHSRERAICSRLGESDFRTRSRYTNRTGRVVQKVSRMLHEDWQTGRDSATTFSEMRQVIALGKIIYKSSSSSLSSSSLSSSLSSMIYQRLFDYFL